MDLVDPSLPRNRRLLLVVDSNPDVREPRQPYIPGQAYRCPISQVLAGTTREAWTDFQARMPFPIEILDASSFRRRFPEASRSLPVIALDEGRNLEVLLEPHTLWGTTNLDHLGWLLDVSLATRAPVPRSGGLAVAA